MELTQDFQLQAITHVTAVNKWAIKQLWVEVCISFRSSDIWTESKREEVILRHTFSHFLLLLITTTLRLEDSHTKFPHFPTAVVSRIEGRSANGAQGRHETILIGPIKGHCSKHALKGRFTDNPLVGWPLPQTTFTINECQHCYTIYLCWEWKVSTRDRWLQIHRKSAKF